MTVTKYFSFIFFSSTFDCFGSIGDLACRKILPFMQSPFFYEPNADIKRTFHQKRKKQRVERQRCKARETSPKMEPPRGEPERRTLQDFITSGVQGITSSIGRATLEVNNFELRLALVSMVQQMSFGGSPIEDPNLHLPIFLEVCDTLKLNRVSTDAICLCLFLFSLKEKAPAWLHSLPSDSITTSDELTKAFFGKFFLPSKTVSLSNQITTFT